ncbi:MAG: glycosyltransferase, partial [Polaromonas sp.]
MFRKVWPIFTSADWVPARQLQSSKHDKRLFLSTGTDPQFRLVHQVTAGWYMLEVRLRLPTTFAEIRLYPDLGEGESEATAMPMRIRTEQLVKRLIHLPKTAKLRFDPMATEGLFQVQHLRLTKVSQAFALKRVRQKLAAKHPMHARKPLHAKPAAFPHHHGTNHSDMQLWADYCKLFESGSELVSYADWIEQVELPQLPERATQAAEMADWAWQPRFSIVTPTYNTDAAMLRACLDSVLAQSYPHWELCIADDASTLPHVRATLAAYAKRDGRIKVSYRPVNGHIVAASNTALERANGDFVVLLDHDDLLAPHALFAVAQAIQQRPTAQLIYSDEDKLDASGQRCDPYFKPDYSPDLLYSQNYFCHLGVYRRELVHAVGGFRQGYEGSQDYDLVLRCVACISDPRDVVHIPQVLYHWRMADGSTAGGHGHKPYAKDAARKALQDHFDDQSLQVQVSTNG